MPLAALIIVEDGSAGSLILGQSLPEFQMRRARAAGAGHAVLLVGRMSAELIAGVDRLKREGLTIDVARSMADVADHVHPEECLLLLSPALIVAPDRLAALAAAPAPTLLTVEDIPGNEGFELIGPGARWTGFALLDGGLVRRTAAMIGDWDPASTLLRQAVQEGAAPMPLNADAARRELSPAAGQTAAALIRPNAGSTSGWGGYWVVGPTSRLLARVLGEANADPVWLAGGGTAALAGAAFLGLLGWIGSGLVLALVAILVVGAGKAIAEAGGRLLPHRRVLSWLRAGSWALLGLGAGLSFAARTGQWGHIVVALVLIGAIAAAAPLRRFGESDRQWLADPSGTAVIVLAGVAGGLEGSALALAAAHAAAGLVVLQRRLLALGRS